MLPNLSHLWRRFGLCSLLIVAVSGAAAQLTVRLDKDGDGVYDRVGVYNVGYAEAVRSFAQAGGSEWTGDGPVLNMARVPGVHFGKPQSWTGFLDFLDRQYGNQQDGRTQDCDDNILVGAITWSCDIVPDPCPGAGCAGFFASATAPLVSCLNDPPCPSFKPECVPIVAIVDIVAFNTVGGTACVCAGEPSACVVGPGVPDGTGIMHEGPVCRCSPGVIIPTVSEWGMIILGLLLAAAGTILFAVSARAPALAGIPGQAARARLLDVGLLSRVGLAVAAATLAALALVAGMSGELLLRDVIGSVLSAAIASYLLHLWILMGRSRS